MVEIEKDGYLFCTKPYEWKLGIGVEIEIFQDDEKIGCVRLLSEANEEKFSTIKELNKTVLLKTATEGFIQNKTKINTGKVLNWQLQLNEIGYNNISP